MRKFPELQGWQPLDRIGGCELLVLRGWISQRIEEELERRQSRRLGRQQQIRLSARLRTLREIRRLIDRLGRKPEESTLLRLYSRGWCRLYRAAIYAAEAEQALSKEKGAEEL